MGERNLIVKLWTGYVTAITDKINATFRFVENVTHTTRPTKMPLRTSSTNKLTTKRQQLHTASTFADCFIDLRRLKNAVALCY